MKHFTCSLATPRNLATLVVCVLMQLGTIELRADPVERSEDAPPWVTGDCEAALPNGAEQPHELCAVGSASEGADVATRTASAEAEGRALLARQLDTPVQSMLAGFHTGAAAGGAVLAGTDVAAPDDVPQHLATTAVGAATRRDLWIARSGTVYALMVLDVPRFQNAVWSDSVLPESLRAHLARAAPRALNDDPAPDQPTIGHAAPGRLMLVTLAEMAALPADVFVRNLSPAAPSDGPIIRIDNPENQATYSGSFPIRVEFLEGPKGYPVDMSSLKLEYKKAWGIDITDRVREYVAGTTIDVAESNLPRGKHTVEIEISDTQGNRSSELFTVTVN